MEIKVVLLTGGSTGIGLELARLLIQKGVKVYSASRRLAVNEKSPEGNGEIIPLVMNVNDKDQIQGAINRITNENGLLDAVICNAGNGIAGSVEDTNEEEMKYQLETNFFGAVKTIQECLPVFRKQGYGRIMVTSSLAAAIPLPYQAFYSAGKSALSIFMQALAMEVRSFGIQCCTILPGNAKTEFTQSRKYTESCLSDESVYKHNMQKSLSNMTRDEINGMDALGVARIMAKQLFRKRMKPVVIPGFLNRLIYVLYHMSPVSFRLRVVSKKY